MTSEVIDAPPDGRHRCPMTTSSPAPTPVSDTPFHRAGLLRTALLLDAGVTGANGAAYLVAAPLLHDVLGLPVGALRAVGAFLLVFAAVVLLVGRRSPINVRAAGVVVALNLVWAVESIAVALLGWGSPTTIGAVWIVLQALVVGGFAALQWAGIRRGRP